MTAYERSFARCGPGAAVHVMVSRGGIENDPAVKALPGRRRWAWRLRRWADRLEGKTVSYTLQGRTPASINADDWWDAICFGTAAMEHYLSDLDADRSS